jgi:hypothetical protein
MDLLRRFSEAGHEGHSYRALTFWSWNDHLDPDEVRRQIREMARGGLGGHFMHARRGLETPYMGPEWMEAVRAAIDEGGHTGITPWLYDENAWPSGAASGRVYTGREAYRQKSLAFEEIQPAKWQPTDATVAVFVARKNAKGEYTAFRRLPEPRAVFGRVPRAEEALLHFVYRTSEYVDVFNRDATEEFLKQTHERYRETVGGEFGRAIPGIFTDEPQYAGAGHRVPWSTELPKYFRRTCRYELVDHLPELFFPVEGCRKTRFDFFQAATRLFLLAWTMPIYQWCQRHGLQLTGHVMAEDTLLGQVQYVGAAMPHYEYMHIPGIDHLGRSLGSPVLVKQVASAAAQFGRERVLGEMFGAGGWGATFDDLRLLAEWQFVLGVNLVCQHLAAFSLRGARKRDFPPSLHYHQPWWPQYYLWNDYAASVLSVLTAGTPVVDVLVIHPIGSAWAEFTPLDPSAVKALDERLRELADYLLGIHADFHFGDELILERKGRVLDGDRPATLAVGVKEYATVIVPDATNLRKSTVELLRKFKKAGGTIIFAGRIPELVDGAPSKDVADLAKTCAKADARTPRGRVALKKFLTPALAVLSAGPGGKDATSILAQWRTVGNDSSFYFLNTDLEKPVKARLVLPVKGTPIRLDATTGQATPLEAKVHGKAIEVEHTFGPRESLLMMVAVEEPSPADVMPAPAEPPPRKQALKGRWNVKRLDPNVLILDTAAWRTDEGAYSDPMPIIDIQQQLVMRGSQEVVILKFEFNCAITDLKGRRFELVLEQPQACEMWYNGMRMPLTDNGAYYDTALRRVDITPFVRHGSNVLELKRPWLLDERRGAILMGRAPGWEVRTTVPDSELENLYLLGDFGVGFPKGSRQSSRGSRWMLGRPELVEEPSRLGGADLIRAGYPFFTGRLALEREVTITREPSPDAVLELPPLSAVTATIHIGGQEAGTVWKSPRAVPIGNLLVRGRNLVSITLTTGLRNLLGPHHHEDGEVHVVSPQSFACTKGWYGRSAGHGCFLDGYNVIDFGLGGDVVLRY